MFHSFFQTICRVGIFMICAQAVIHFRPKEIYEKYLKLLVSIMILIQLFLPIGNLLLGENRQETAESLERIRREMEQSLKEAEENTAAVDALLEQMTLEEVRERIEMQKQEQDAEQREDMGEEDNENGMEETERERSAVDPVRIDSISLEKRENED